MAENGLSYRMMIIPRIEEGQQRESQLKAKVKYEGKLFFC